MPLIQFDDTSKSPPVKIQKRMFAPKKKVSELDQWMKDAKRLIPEIPDCTLLSGWRLNHTYVTATMIIFSFCRRDNYQAKARLIIDRRAASIG